MVPLAPKARPGPLVQLVRTALLVPKGRLGLLDQLVQMA